MERFFIINFLCFIFFFHIRFIYLPFVDIFMTIFKNSNLYSCSLHVSLFLDEKTFVVKAAQTYKILWKASHQSCNNCLFRLHQEFGPKCSPAATCALIAVPLESIVESTTVFPHHLGGSIPFKVNAKNMKSVASARPKSKPDDVKKFKRLHHRK